MKKYILLLISFLNIISCQHDLENPNWDIDVIMPLAHSKMNINDLLTDTNLIVNEDNQGLISLVFNQDFIDLNIDSIIRIDTVADEEIHKLDSVTFEDITISDTATIGETISAIPGGPILFPNGSTNTIPSILGIANQDTINIDASQYFNTMTLYRGYLIVEIINNYPTDISNISLSLVNPSNQNILANFSFPLIISGESALDSVDIGGLTIDENIIGILNNMDLNASNGAVSINYNDAIITKITISDIGLTEATAIFPEQQLTENLKEHSFNFGSAQLQEIGIKEGTVSVNVLSTLPNGKMIYNIPSLKKNGVSFTSGEMIVPQATSNNVTTFIYNFEDYVLDLTGEDGRIGGDTINTIYTEAFTYIDSTGILEYINYTDSFYSYVEFDITPKYAKGFLGNDTIQFGPEEIDLSFFNKMSASNIDLVLANLNLSINNFFGADIGLQINDLSTINSKTGQTNQVGQDQNGNNIINNIYNINRASLSNNQLPIIPFNKNINVNSDELLEILPDIISTEATFYLNPNSNQNTQDFVYPEFPLEASIEIEIPLHFIAEDLTLTDTNEIKLVDQENISIDYINIILNNGFPFDGKIDLIALDEQDEIIDTILNNASVISADINQNNEVIENYISVIKVDDFDFTNASKLISTCSFSTNPVNEYVKIYSNYSMDITISAKFKQKIGN